MTALATPLLLGALAVPSGGLFRGAKFRDLHVYRAYGDALLDGRLPYRDVFVEYPPGAIPLFAAPSLAPGGWYDAALQGADDALRASARSTWSTLLLARRGAGVPELAVAAAFLALVADRARARLAEHLRRVACRC